MKKLLLTILILFSCCVTCAGTLPWQQPGSRSVNSISTNAYSGVVDQGGGYYDVTYHATLNSKAHPLQIYGFIIESGAGGDPRFGDAGAKLVGASYGDCPLGSYSGNNYNTGYLRYNTLYRVAAAALDSVTGEVFYGSTITIQITQ